MAAAAIAEGNNGAALVLRFEKVKTQTMRELIATGVLNELEFGLLKGSSKAKTGDKTLGWGVEEKAVLLNMEVDNLIATQGSIKLEIQVRSLCFSRGVTADYLKSEERFNMKQCVLVLGDLGKGVAPWSELVQSAVFLHRKEFNIIWIDVPNFKSNPTMWVKFGAETLRGLLKFLRIKEVSVVSRGIGGAVFLEALAKAPELFARTHFVYNMDIPPGKGFQLPIFELEEVLRKREVQLWFAFKDDEDYDRFMDGTPQKAYDSVQKIQSRLTGERQRSKRVLHYDEVLITENLNANPNNQHVQDLKMSIYTILVYSTSLLESIAFFLEIAPGTKQDGMEGGLVGDFRATSFAEALEGGGVSGEPLSLRRNRIGHLHGLSDRREKAKSNKRMLNNVSSAVSGMTLALPAVQNGETAGFSDELTKRLEDRGSISRGFSPEASGSRGGSQGGSRVTSRSGSQAGSRGGSQGGSRPGTKDLQGMAPALPALLRTSQSSVDLRVSRSSKDSNGSVASSSGGLRQSASTGTMQALALANEAANQDSDDEDEDEEEAGGLLEGILGPKPAGQLPWQNYRRMWQQMHGKAPSGYTHPMKSL